MATINNVGNGLSGESGTGAFAGTTSPTFVTPALGTPSSGNLSNCTGLPVSGISATGTPSATTFLRGDGSWNAPAGLTLTGFQIFTTAGSGTYTPTAGTVAILVEITAGGGGGGGVAAAASSVAAAGGGGSGSYQRKF